MEKERLLQETVLGNGLMISFYDASKTIAGDRCQVQLRITIPIRLDTVISPHDQQPLDGFLEFASAFEGEILYRQTKVRNFIPKDLLAPTLDRMRDDFLAANAAYLASPSFARRYVMSRFQEWKRERMCQTLHREAIMRADNEPASP